jgi:hypothetical protein
MVYKNLRFYQLLTASGLLLMMIGLLMSFQPPTAMAFDQPSYTLIYNCEDCDSQDTFTCSVPAGQYLITFTLRPELEAWGFKTYAGPASEIMRDDARCWRCVGKCSQYPYHVEHPPRIQTLDMGNVNAGQIVYYNGVDDQIENPSRRQEFYINNTLVYQVPPGMWFSGSFTTNRAGNLEYRTTESVYANMIIETPVTPTPTVTPTPAPTCSSCEMAPVAANPAVGDDPYTLVVTALNGTAGMGVDEGVDDVDRVEFSFNPDPGSSPTTVTLDKASDSTFEYNVQVTPEQVGSGIINAEVLLEGGVGSCSCQSSVTVSPPRPWFQVAGGDVYAGSNISSEIPSTCVSPDCEPYFSVTGTSGPSVVYYNGTSASFGNGEVSENGWLINNTSQSSQSYGYFYQLLGSPTVDNFDDLDDIDNNVTNLYYSEDDVIIERAHPANQKGIVFVNGDVYLNHDIKIQDGDFLMIAASGDIYVEGGGTPVDELEGIYVAGGTFHTGVAEVQLEVEGGVVAGNFNLQRDLGADNEDTPAEIFTYRLDFWFSAPDEIRQSPFTWGEVRP